MATALLGLERRLLEAPSAAAAAGAFDAAVLEEMRLRARWLEAPTQSDPRVPGGDASRLVDGAPSPRAAPRRTSAGSGPEPAFREPRVAVARA